MFEPIRLEYEDVNEAVKKAFGMVFSSVEGKLVLRAIAETTGALRENPAKSEIDMAYNVGMRDAYLIIRGLVPYEHVADAEGMIIKQAGKE